MNKAYIFFIVILLIAGCKGTGKEYNPSITGEQIYSGKDGLIMEFLKDAPPGTAFDLSVIPIGLNLYNKGAFDITEGYLSIMLEKDYMELNTGSLRSINGKTSLQDSSKIGFELKGKQINLPNGDRDVITFTANTQELQLLILYFFLLPDSSAMPFRRALQLPREASSAGQGNLSISEARSVRRTCSYPCS